MSEKKQVGGLRSTLAFIMSLIALVLSFLAYSTANGNADLTTHIQELQTKLDAMKQESSKQIDALRGETSNALDKMSQALKKDAKESAKAGQ